MLLFIEDTRKKHKELLEFQNIVCYCLSLLHSLQMVWKARISKHRMLLFINMEYLRLMLGHRFQNIVCYCLSQGLPEKRCLYCKFQNIVCYCLSDKHHPGETLIPEFQNIVCYCLSAYSKEETGKPEHFKTSYVTVYPPRILSTALFRIISKHRMLLFIPFPLQQ